MVSHSKNKLPERAYLSGSLFRLAASAVPVKPFANVVTGNACGYRHNKISEDTHGFTPSLLSG